VDRHIRNLRIKLQNHSQRSRYIATVPGRGYRFVRTADDSVVPTIRAQGQKGYRRAEFHRDCLLLSSEQTEPELIPSRSGLVDSIGSIDQVGHQTLTLASV